MAVPSADVTAPPAPRPAGAVPVALAALAGPAGAVVRAGEDGSAAVTGITASSADVRPGDLFAGVPGARAHGARFAADAVAAGAVAVLTDADGAAAVPDGTPVLVTAGVRAALGPVAAAVYGHPSRGIAVLGVTGTSGKTTTTHLLRAALPAPSGLVGTVTTAIGAEQLRTSFTTPEAPQLQALLAVMRERGCRHVAMEVSSHALAMGRVDGTEFAVGAFTNLTQDHLDFHPTMEDYFAAKARLFDGRARRAVVVVDDAWGRRLLGPDTVTVSTTERPAHWRAEDVRERPDGSTAFRVVSPHGAFDAGCAVPGRYNVANAVLALAVLDAAGLDAAAAAPAVAAATVPGRMERVDAGQPFLAVVDYSHKPAAVEGALRALRPLTAGRLVLVLGCGGDRDRGKRPLMGEVGARDADVLVITDDNPRSEDPAAIRAAVLRGRPGGPGPPARGGPRGR